MVASRETVQHALSDHAASTKALLDADFTVFDTAELLAIQSERERYARADAMIGHRIQAALMDRATAHEIGGKSWVDVLATRMRISRTDAARRVRDAEVLGPRHAMNGEVLAPVLPACATALAEGSIAAEHIAVVRATLKAVSGRMSGTELAQLEASLVAAAKTTIPETLKEAATRVLYTLNQDGDGPDMARHKRGITLGPQDADGLVRISGWVDAELAAYLATAHEVWGRPGVNNPDDPEPKLNPDPNPLEDEEGPAPDPAARTDEEPADTEGAEGETVAEDEDDSAGVAGDADTAGDADPRPTDFGALADLATSDTRTRAQRLHDALKAILRDALMAKNLGQHNGIPVTVVVSTTLAELEAGAGIAVTGTGTLMPMPDLIRLAEQAYHYLVVYRKHTAEPLYLGRTKRLANKAQRLLLYNRDRGCTRPGCTQAACRCQAHHAEPSWNNGGLTDAPSLALGCGPDNRLAEMGWTTSIDKETGRTHWYPPPLMDTGGDTLNHHFHPDELLPPEEPNADGEGGG
ncbi:hypothetical protein A7U43_21250 [Mycobacterium adipatum]|uniref:DUF222 domain-containing protein n=1 Tax=Mycobacterium adipatum TaxID=1682113 RepID=A0A172UVI0_9MYCO|nr:hypothetical protein A7U43_21250 [Mycobacterium adipatum]